MADAQEELEQLDSGRQPIREDRPKPRPTRNSGPLRGFNDPATLGYNPLPIRPAEGAGDAKPTQQPTAQSEAATAQEFRAGTIEAQRRQGQQTPAGPSSPRTSLPSSIAAAGQQQAINAGAEAVVSKLGAQGFAIVTVIKFLREHKTLTFIILFLLGAFAFFLLGFVVIALYYAVNQCEAQNLPLPAFTKIIITLTNFGCVFK